MRFRNSSGERIRLGSGSRMNDEECCCGYATCAEIMAAIIASDYPTTATISFPGRSGCGLSAGSYVFDFDSIVDNTIIYHHDLGFCTLVYGLGCISLPGEIALGHCVNFEACSSGCGTGCLYRSMPLTIEEALADGTIEFIGYGISVDFSLS